MYPAPACEPNIRHTPVLCVQALIAAAVIGPCMMGLQIGAQIIAQFSRAAQRKTVASQRTQI